MKKFFVFLIITGSIVAVLLGALWYSVNSYFIPKVVVPRLQAYIADLNKTSPLKFSVKNIYFHSLNGFILEGINVTGEAGQVLSARFADIDMNYLALLDKKVSIQRIKITAAGLNISRDRKGQWNFAPLLKMDVMSRGTVETIDISIDEISFSDSQVVFDDHYDRHNKLKKVVIPVDLVITAPSTGEYRVRLWGGNDEPAGESLQLEMTISEKEQKLEGRAECKIRSLANYWAYYLDDIFAPWQVKADRLAGEVKFQLKKDVLALDGRYEIKKGVILYGDYLGRGDAKIRHRQKFRRGRPIADSLHVQATLEGFSAFAGKKPIIQHGQCHLAIADGQLVVNQLTGDNGSDLIELTGEYNFAAEKTFRLNGSIGVLRNEIRFKLLPSNRATAYWHGRVEESFFIFSADITDLKNMVFVANIKGNIDLENLDVDVEVDLSSLEAGFRPRTMLSIEAVKKELPRHNLRGEVGFSGELRGEFDQPQSLAGRLGLAFKNISLYGLEPKDFKLGFDAKDGLFRTGVPETEFYKGKIAGAIIFDLERWGLALDIEDCDIGELGKTSSELAGMHGRFTGKLACVGRGGDFQAIRGGGYFNLSEADLRGAPIFKNLEQGIRTVVKDFEMPDFKKIEGNYELKDQQVKIENAFCKASSMDLRVSGTAGFMGQVDFTAGIKMFGGVFKTIRQILIPVTIGFDLAANSIRVNVSGVWPDIKQTTKIQPMNWLGEFYNVDEKFNPDKYRLDQLWQAE
ncbi:MAG: hypothetical protein PHH14_05850 [Candidatus Margulisbacteria bacterium]|nr:hypothetical protein [Candidatus Margulisiibacteriota bacterium]